MAQLNTYTKAAICMALAALMLATGARQAKAERANLQYEIIKLALPDPNCNYSYATSINNDGVVVGVCGENLYDRNETIIWQKFFLYKDGMFKELNFPEDNSRYITTVINDWGEILVRAGSGESTIYRINETVELEKPSGDLNFWGKDMNNKGEVIGHYGYYYRDGETINLHNFSNGYGLHPAAINDNSQITGYTYKGYEPHHAFRLDMDSKEFTLFKGPLSHNVSLDINSKGQCVGSISGPGTFACIWDKEGNLTQIGEDWSRAYAINDKGQVVGVTDLPHGGEGFLYEDGKMKNLNDLIPEDSKVGLIRAWDINNNGQILVDGRVVENSKWRDYVYLMNPKPKPNADLNEDKIVNWEDFAIFADQWLMTELWYE